MPGLVGGYLRPVLHPPDGGLPNEGMSVRASITIRRHSERRRGVSSGERVLILFSLPRDYVGEMFSCVACILQIGAGARVNDGNVEQKRLLLESGQTI